MVDRLTYCKEPVGLDAVIKDVQDRQFGFLKTLAWANHSVGRAKNLSISLEQGTNVVGVPLSEAGKNSYDFEIQRALVHAEEAIEAGVGVNSKTWDDLQKLREKHPKPQES